MSVSSAYLGVIFIWSTTPLAIKWSGEGVGYLFGLSGRMVIGLICVSLMLVLLRRRVIWNRDNWPSYMVAGIQLYLAMSLVYWAAQYVPSGWISVIYGLTPILTTLLASVWLKDHRITTGEVVGALLGFGGLLVMFASSFQLNLVAVWALVAIVLSALTHSAGAVLVKRFNAGIDGISLTTGSLALATPLFLVSWWIGDGHSPQNMDWHNIGPIVYLGIFGSALGFSLYFYLLKSISVRAIALITLMTPVVALWLGQSLNGETLTTQTFLGTALILAGLALSQFGQESSSN